MKLLTLTLMVCAIAAGCESTPHYNRTKVAVIRQFPKRPYGSVELFENKDDVKKPYEVIAYMSIDGKAGDEAAFMKAFLYRAADVGADAVIFNRNIVAGEGGGGWVVGRNGGFGLPTKPSQEGVFRAEAIHYRTP